MMKVQFLDLKAQYESIRDEISIAIQKVLENTAFAGGPFVTQFEKEFAEFCGCKHAIGVGSGTEALWMSLMALGVGQGDEVITVPNTFIATAEAISFCDAKPVFVDVDEQTYNMDPNKLEDYLKKRFRRESRVVSGKVLTRNSQPELHTSNSLLTPNASRLTALPKAVIPVHLFGQMADLDPIVEIARKYGLFVIEDACQAHGAQYKGRPAGSIGDMGCFSFYPGKNLGAYGEAGAVVTNDGPLAEKIRMLRNHGQPKKYYHDYIGWNGRMDGIQGAVLSVKLKHLMVWNEARRKNAQRYDELLADAEGVIVPKQADYAKHVYHIYPIRVRNRDALKSHLAEKNINCGIHYPVPIHLQDAYKFLKIKEGSFPIAEKCAQEFVSLPMFPELTEEQIEYVADEIKRFHAYKERSNISCLTPSA
jgi:dTDP-4-amino-4,6-dideoxygalactose transaminase